ncbi:MAG: LacI family DNA-binding transcriptional regulator [Lentisphaeria bacterium]|nr:LacI family DNA-binding transcriptional regulator [Lentisphaeria bacterium]
MEKRMTIKDIARLAGVSVGAVSTAFSKKSSNVHLSEKTREKIFRIAQEYHYIPSITARSMQSQKSYLLGFFYRSNNPFLQTNLLKGIKKVCYEHDYDIIVYPCDTLEEEAHNLQTPHVNQLDGIITTPIIEDGKTNELLYRSLLERGIPLIQLFADLWADLPFIGRDYRQIGSNAVNLLYKNGHSHIAMMAFANYTDRRTGLNNAMMVEGVQNAADSLGLELELLTIGNDASREEYIREADREAEKLIRMSRRPTALITASGLLAYGAYTCITRNGIKVPSEISLLACGDDIEQFSQIAPNLSYFPVQLEEIGMASARFCLEKGSGVSLKQYFTSSVCKGNTISAAGKLSKK